MKSIGILLAVLLAAVLLSLPGYFLAGGRAASTEPPLAPLVQEPPPGPLHGWMVCAVLPEGTIPGLPDQRQRFELCHPEGWRIQVYCRNPGMPLPELGALCSQIGEGHFWCGTGIQELQMYGLLQTPVPTPTAPATATATATPIATLPPILTSTPIVIAATAIPTTALDLNTPAAPYDRPRAGGPGPLDLLGWLLALGGLAALPLGLWKRLLPRRR
jgi:hypothetical protein